MDWIRHNRFLFTYLVVMVLGLAGLSYLVYAGYDRYSQVSEEYRTQVAELKRLQNLPPYPNAANLQRYNDVKKSYAAAVVDLQKQLAALEPAADPVPPTPLQFQDRLRKVVEEVVHSAQGAGVGLPPDFYLGFEQYRGTPPDTAATPGLSAELDAIRDLVDILIRRHVEKLSNVVRAPLPQEAGGGGAAAAAAVTTRPGPGRTAGPAITVVRNAVQVEFTALPSVFRESLNLIVGAPRLYVISRLIVRNETDKGPPRGVDQSGGPAHPGGPPGAPGAPAPGAPGQPPPDPNAPPGGPPPDKGAAALRYVVGQEKVNVSARIELVKIVPPR